MNFLISHSSGSSSRHLDTSSTSNDMDEDDALQVDSPEQEPVDDIEDEELPDDLHLPPSVASSPPPSGKPTPKLPKRKEKPREEQLEYQKSLPYETESLQEMDDRLELIVRRLIDCMRAKDYDVGFVQWNHRLECWISLKYPMKREIRAKLAKLYFELSVLPGLDARLVDISSGMAMSLLEPKKRIDVSDLQLPWRPIYAILEKELFPKQRKTGHTNVGVALLSLTEYAQRFFPPHEIPSMLKEFLPRLSSNLNSILATQAFCCHFLPISHPQYYLPAVFKLWEAFNSNIWDEQWLDFMERLAAKHLDPVQSHPEIVEELRQMAKDNGQFIDASVRVEDLDKDAVGGDVEMREELNGEWKGIRKDVGIFTDDQWAFIITKCLRAMGVPVGGGTSQNSEGVAASDFAFADSNASGIALTMKKPAEKLGSFAALIVYSMAADSPAAGATPLGSKVPTPSTSTTDLPSLGAKKQKTYLAGSKALDSLAKLIQATESFFHPSNYGGWAPKLGRFLQHVTWEFHKRQKEEEHAECKTPLAWRLTPEIRRQFVLTMRTVALLSMFSRDPLTIANSQSALKTMAYLEPDLIFPAVLERAYPALETLTETHRTTACITALSTLAPALISRSVYPAGAKHLVPLLELCLPGFDVNDPIKTMSTAMFVLQAINSVVVDDLTRIEAPEGASSYDEGVPMITVEGEESKPSRQEEDRAVRESTAGFPDWVSSFFRQVLVVFEALPEPGKNNRNGGKMEDQMTGMLIAACDAVCCQLSPTLFDLALDIVFKEVTSNVRSNSARVVSQLTSCFARINPDKTIAKFLPVCATNIRLELEGGASSVRTTSSNSLIESDVTLHWWIGLLTGTLTNATDRILKHKKELKDLLKFMIEHCRSERGYSSTGRILGIMLLSLTNVSVRDYRSVNPSQWSDDDWQKRHYEEWGKLYEAKEVKIDWHVPNDEEIDFALELLREIVEPALVKVNSLLEESSGTPSLDWANDFCRYSNILRSALSGIPSLIWLPPPEEPGAPACDAGDEIPEFISQLPHCVSGICLTDPSDPRHQFVHGLRTRIGQFLHHAVQSLKNNGAEDSIDCVKMIISSIRILQLDYPSDHGHYSLVKKSYDFAVQVSRTTRNQKKFPRFVWVRRANLYHSSRMRVNSFYRKRTALDDLLIGDLCELALSVYVQVRKSAQRGLESMTHYYDGTRTLLYPRLFEALKPGTNHDVMKGAAYVLGSKLFGNLAILDWRFGPTYLEAFLQCSHQERPSVQNLVKTILHDFVIRLAEPSTLKAAVYSEGLQLAASELESLIAVAVDQPLVDRVAAKAGQRVDQKNRAYDELVPKLLAFAESPDTHWRYALTATRLLRALIRRDQPLRPDVAAYVSKQLISDLPNQRSHSMLALAKILHFIKLRTTCEGSGEKLLLQQTSNPLRRTVKLEHPLPADFTDRFIESFSKPLDRDTLLSDKQETGWLVWGDTVDFYAVPSETASVFSWDSTSAETIESVRSFVVQASWWETFIKHLSQEKTADTMASDVVTIVKSIFQIYGAAPCEFVLPALETLIADKADRHKQRAAAELLGGMLRGSKHWPLDQQKIVWDWLTPLLPSIFGGVTPETQVAWEMFVEYVLSARDPRRNQPLVDYLTNRTIDPDSSEAFNTAKQQDLVGTAMKALNWHFSPWAPKFIDMYSKSIDHPFGEVRAAVADNLRTLSELRLHPSYSSIEQFLADCRLEKGSERSLMNVDAEYEAKIDYFAERLAAWRAVRQSSAHGTQTYDKAALTILNWLWTSISDFRISTAFPFITKLLPELFRMQEILDNTELHKMAIRVLIAVACLPYPIQLAGPLMRQYMTLLKTSTSWRVRLDVLLPLQMFYFHNLFLLDDEIIAELMDQLCDLLRDPKIEVREAAAATLSGIVRCSQRSAIISLSSRFMAVVRSTKIPKRRNAAGEEVAGYQDALVKAHSGVLGITSLINAFPYEVPPFIPSILVECMSLHAASPVPISTSVKACLADFKRSHTDSWAEDQKAFSEDQLASLHDLLTGSSYYA